VLTENKNKNLLIIVLVTIWLVVLVGLGYIVALKILDASAQPSSYSVANDKPVLVLGGSLNSQIGVALEGSGVTKVYDETNVNVLIPNNALYNWREDWEKAILLKRPEVVIVAAGSLKADCQAATCKLISAESRAAQVQEILDIVEPVPFVVWVGLPKFGPGGGSTWLGENALEKVAKLNLIDEKVVKSAGRIFISPDKILKGFQLERKGVDGKLYQARRTDNIHYCPVAAGAIAQKIGEKTFKNFPEYKSWWKGSWWKDAKFYNGSLGVPCNLVGKN
jgi:hypothetical protein